MSLLVIYDEMLGGILGQLGRQQGEIANRAQLLRHQLAERVVGELAMDVHSFALPVLTAYLSEAARLYLLGFYDVAIVETSARTAAVLRGRLLSLLVWESRAPGSMALFAAVRAEIEEWMLRRHPALSAPASPDDVRRLYRERGFDALEALPFATLIARADAAGVFAGPWRERLVASLCELAEKSQAVDVRNQNQGRQIALAALERGQLSGGPGAAHTEPILGYYLAWGANLHQLLADAVATIALVLARAPTPVVAPA